MSVLLEMTGLLGSLLFVYGLARLQTNGSNEREKNSYATKGRCLHGNY